MQIDHRGKLLFRIYEKIVGAYPFAIFPLFDELQSGIWFKHNYVGPKVYMFKKLRM